MLLYYLVKYAVWLCEHAHTVECGQAVLLLFVAQNHIHAISSHHSVLGQNVSNSVETL